MKLPRLPIGIQTFGVIRTEGYAYVDKTPFILELSRAGKYYFLSRPRRFGKSLFVDTLDCAFSGRRQLFAGLALDDPDSGWDWNAARIVLRIDFAGGTLRSLEDLESRLHRILDAWEKKYEIARTEGSPGDRLLAIVPAIAARTGATIVILVDEYDKPILDNLENRILAASMRDGLRDFYGAIKPLDPFLAFVFLTGVSKFAKAGIFSGLNNLKDITVDGRYSALCGYTQEDLETIFSGYLCDFDAHEVRSWYNGYGWGGTTVYNPFDILLLFDEQDFKAFWFETGTPTFLVKLLQEKPRCLPELDGLVAGDELLGSFSIEDLKPETLLFQAGYLTIKEIRRTGLMRSYVLGFPNLEVRSSFSLLTLSMIDVSRPEIPRGKLAAIMESGDGTGLREAIQSFFASISHHWYANNGIARFEGFYASVIYALFASLGYEVIPEDSSNRGRADLTVKTREDIWIFEFKVRGIDRTGDRSPLAQIRERGYSLKYSSDGRRIHEIGIVFDAATRNIESWEEGDSEK